MEAPQLVFSLGARPQGSKDRAAAEVEESPPLSLVLDRRVDGVLVEHLSGNLKPQIQTLI